MLHPGILSLESTRKSAEVKGSYIKLQLAIVLCCLLPPANVVCDGYVFTGVCHSFCSQGGGGACVSPDQLGLYKELHCWWVSVGEEAAYR